MGRGVSPVTWDTVQSIAGDSDVSTSGTLAYAEIWGGTPGTVNGVPFTAAGVNVTTVTTVNPFGNNRINTSALPAECSAAYQGILNSIIHNYPGLMTLHNLVAGHQYQVQVWSYQPAGGTGLH